MRYGTIMTALMGPGQKPLRRWSWLQQ